MTKDSAKQLMDNPALKLIVLVVTVCGSVGGSLYMVLKRIDSIESKMDTYMATQKGVDDIQTFRQISIEADVKEINDWRFSFSSQPAMKPKPIVIESE